MKLLIATTLLVVVAAVWWYAFDSRAPRSAPDAIPMADLAAVIADDPPVTRPSSVELYRVGSGQAPMYAVEAGGGLGKFRMAYTAFGLLWPDRRIPERRIIVDAAADRETAMAIGDAKAARFADSTYSLLADRIASADLILLTHEHKDHVMAVARHPALPGFAKNLLVPEAQKYGILRYVDSDPNREAIESLATSPLTRAQRVAPGVAIAPAPGHSPGSVVILVHLSNGHRYLFVGDIAWSFDDIRRLKTRPRFLQWIMFDPNEDRPAVLRQLRGLHDLLQRDPSLTIIPSHDDEYLDGLVAKRLLVEQ